MITPRQIRAARALLEWDISDLAASTELSREAIGKIENGHSQAREGTVERIVRAFDKAGVEFTDNEGVRFKPRDVETFIGIDRFQDFSEFLYQHLKQYGGDVCISTVDEYLFAKYRKDHELHRKRMKELVDGGQVTFRILATESKFTSEYAKHRWIPSEKNAAPTSFYSFGDCLALISFAHDPAPYVVLHKSGPFAEAFRQSFNIAWDNAQEPPKVNL